MKKVLAILVVALMASPAVAGSIATPHAAGSMQGWDEDANPMVETAPGSDIWTVTFTGLDADARYEWKVTDGTWDSTLPGPNSWLFTDGNGDVTLTYDGNTYDDGWAPNIDRLGVSVDPATWTAVGDWQSQLGGGDWDNANPNTAMTHIGGGIYSLSATLTPGSYNWKAAVTGSWDSISWDARSINTSNWGFDIDEITDTATFYVDSYTGVARIELTPEPATMTLLAFGALALIRRR